jgi:hypothetical protein
MGNLTKKRGKHVRVFCVMLFAILFFSTLFLSGELPVGVYASPEYALYLRIRDLKTGEIYVSSPAKIGNVMFFGWIHSLEKIPWNEYYHIGEDLTFVLDAITFPAFGAGIPENKGRVCYIKDNLIHMEEIDQKFKELVWLNSHTATQEITLDGNIVTRGDSLPHHSRLRMVVEKECMR